MELLKSPNVCHKKLISLSRKADDCKPLISGNSSPRTALALPSRSSRSYPIHPVPLIQMTHLR
jgi:hypothetical protein